MENQNLFDLHIDEESTRFLKETAKWGRFLSILAFIVLGFYLLFLIFVGLIRGAANSATMEMAYGNNPMAGFMATAGGVIFIVIIMALMFIPVVYLYRFSTRMKMALETNDQATLNNSFGNLKSMFKFYGIYTIVCLGIMVLSFLFALIFIGANFA